MVRASLRLTFLQSFSKTTRFFVLNLPRVWFGHVESRVLWPRVGLERRDLGWPSLCPAVKLDSKGVPYWSSFGWATTLGLVAPICRCFGFSSFGLSYRAPPVTSVCALERSRRALGSAATIMPVHRATRSYGPPIVLYMFFFPRYGRATSYDATLTAV